MTHLQGTKLVEVPYFINQLKDVNKSVLIIGECHGGVEGVSESVLEKGFSDVTTTDIMPLKKNSWLETNTNWKHIQTDFIKFDIENKYDYIISISVFEHFGFWFAGNKMANGLSTDDACKWNHDILGINTACKLLKNHSSKLIITLPAGPYMNYEQTGEPFLRYYDYRRQKIIKDEIRRNGYYISDEKFFISENFLDWEEVTSEINDPKYYSYYNPHTPNVIWAFTIQKL